eukprot:488936-Rhodomonas_salina.2
MRVLDRWKRTGGTSGSSRRVGARDVQNSQWGGKGRGRPGRRGGRGRLRGDATGKGAAATGILSGRQRFC